MNSAAMCRQIEKTRLQFGVDKADERYRQGLQIPESSGLFTVSYELLLTKSFRRPSASRKIVLKGELNHCFHTAGSKFLDFFSLFFC